MFDVITIGSATKDIFLEAGKLKRGDCLCLPLGEKIEMEKIFASFGGGAVNTACTFVLQGLKTAVLAAVGNDLAGEEIVQELKEKGISASMVKAKKGETTDLGLIFHAQGDRTIILFHGASKTLAKQDIVWKELKNTCWLYLAPLWGKAANLTQQLINFSSENKIKTAINPSIDQLSLPYFKTILEKIDVLLLNNDEACFLAGAKEFKETEVFKKISYLTPAIIVITKGEKGASALDSAKRYTGHPARYKNILYQMAAPRIKVIDATGAGDSFGSGFVAGLMKTKNIREAMQLAMANAVSNIRVLGANNGLLAKGESYNKVDVKKSML